MIPNIGSGLFCGAFPPIWVFWEIGRVVAPVEVSLTYRYVVSLVMLCVFSSFNSCRRSEKSL